MTYEVAFDVSQRLPQLGIGIVAAIAIVIFVAVGLWSIDPLVARWPLVFGLGAACILAQWLIAGQWPYALAGAIVIGGIIVIGRSEPGRAAATGPMPPGSRRTVLGLFLLVFAALQGLPMVAAIDLTRRLDAGQATVIEGRVTIEPLGKTECLVVDARRFCYSEWEVTPGYHRMQYIIGSVESGDQVRVSVIDDMIVRLEVASEP